MLKIVVAKKQSSNGVGGWLTTDYQYQGIGQQGKEVFLGFDAMRIHNADTGITTYREYHLWAQTAKVKHEYVYDGFYPNGTLLSQRVAEHVEHTLDRGVHTEGTRHYGMASFYD